MAGVNGEDLKDWQSSSTTPTDVEFSLSPATGLPQPTNNGLFFLYLSFSHGYLCCTFSVASWSGRFQYNGESGIPFPLPFFFFLLLLARRWERDFDFQASTKSKSEDRKFKSNTEQT